MIVENTLYRIKQTLTKTVDKIRHPMEDMALRFTDMLPEAPKVGLSLGKFEDFMLNLTDKAVKPSEVDPIIVSSLDQFIKETHIKWALAEDKATLNVT